MIVEGKVKLSEAKQQGLAKMDASIHGKAWEQVRDEYNKVYPVFLVAVRAVNVEVAARMQHELACTLTRFHTGNSMRAATAQPARHPNSSSEPLRDSRRLVGVSQTFSSDFMN